ncbi:MAG: signal peptide peptidase SppA [Bacteroidales bacterium]|nr:signal peptide peptidase SppA [Bacteroidales bacterium]
MKQFLKMTLACITGIIIASIICMFLSFSIMAGIIASTETTTEVSERHSVLRIDLDKAIVERTNPDDLADIFNVYGSIYNNQQIGLNLLINAIKNAETNNNIDGIYLAFDGMSASPASIQELRNELLKFKETGKFIVAYGASYSNGEYHLASVADKILLNPQGSVALSGIQMQTMFYSELLSKVGVEMEIFKVGTFKSAVEPYIRTDMSEANKLQLHTYADGVWARICDDIATSRNITTEAINDFANHGDFLKEPEVAINTGLIDSLCYVDGMKTLLEKLTKKDFKTYYVEDMCQQPEQDKKAKDQIAIVYATGGIDDNTASEMNSEKIAKTLMKLRDNKKIKAVVLRVNSPGGSAYGSEQMWHAAELLKEKKPVVVSMGDYAASGGYYMSCNANYIFAQPNTLTGSIGIFGMFPNLTGASKKIGVSVDGIKTNEYADLGNTFRPMRNDEKELIQAEINRGYELFTSRCANGRHMSQDSIKAIAEGRVWSGVDALAIGLVDELGGLDMAIAKAAELAKINNYVTKNFPAQKSKMEELTDLLSGKSDKKEEKMLQKALGDNYQIYQAIKNVKEQQGIMAISPYYIIY